mgnify:CR=1 FL=1
MITGTDINGDSLTETVAITASAGTYAGVKAFRTITSVVYGAAGGTGATVSIGYGAVFGLSRKAKTRAGAVNRGIEISAGSVVTNGTLVVAGTSGPNNQVGGYTEATKPQGTSISSGGFVDDGARRMPSSNDPVYNENLKRLRAALSSRSGRSSTSLSGTRPFVNTFLGGTL